MLFWNRFGTTGAPGGTTSTPRHWFSNFANSISSRWRLLFNHSSPVDVVDVVRFGQEIKQHTLFDGATIPTATKKKKIQSLWKLLLAIIINLFFLLMLLSFFLFLGGDGGGEFRSFRKYIFLLPEQRWFAAATGTFALTLAATRNYPAPRTDWPEELDF